MSIPVLQQQRQHPNNHMWMASKNDLLLAIKPSLAIFPFHFLASDQLNPVNQVAARQWKVFFRTKNYWKKIELKMSTWRGCVRNESALVAMLCACVCSGQQTQLLGHAFAFHVFIIIIDSRRSTAVQRQSLHINIFPWTSAPRLVLVIRETIIVIMIITLYASKLMKEIWRVFWWAYSA